MMKTENRMAQYKNGGRAALRDRLRKSCLDRLRASRRDDIISSHRNMHERVDTIIREVLAADKPVSEEFGLEMIEQLKAELLQDELDELIAFEKARDAEYEAHLGPQEVFCPACMKGILSFNINTIRCKSCRFSHTFTFTAVPTQSRLYEWLSQVCTAHAEKCTAPITPVENSTLSGSPLTLECEFCSTKAVMSMGDYVPEMMET